MKEQCGFKDLFSSIAKSSAGHGEGLLSLYDYLCEGHLIIGTGLHSLAQVTVGSGCRLVGMSSSVTALTRFLYHCFQLDTDSIRENTSPSTML